MRPTAIIAGCIGLFATAAPAGAAAHPDAPAMRPAAIDIRNVPATGWLAPTPGTAALLGLAGLAALRRRR